MGVELDLELLHALVTAAGPAGMEGQVAEVIRSHPVAQEAAGVEEDLLGNLILDLGGSGPVLLIDAHMDEVGFMVRLVDSAGFIRVIPLGGMDAQTASGQRVIIHSGSGIKVPGIIGHLPPHVSSEDGGGKPGRISDLYIDTGLEPGQVKDLVSPGDTVVFPDVWEVSGSSVMARALDDRVGLFVILEALKRLKGKRWQPKDYRLYVSFTVQEENGLKGAGPVAERIRPVAALAVEGTVANDVPGVSEDRVLARLGHGPEIRLSDGRFLADRRLCRFLADTAWQAGIRHQIVVKEVGGTNAGMFQVRALGCMAGALSVPVRYIHAPCGIARLSDIEGAVQLLAAFLEEARGLMGS